MPSIRGTHISYSGSTGANGANNVIFIFPTQLHGLLGMLEKRHLVLKNTVIPRPCSKIFSSSKSVQIGLFDLHTTLRSQNLMEMRKNRNMKHELVINKCALQ